MGSAEMGVNHDDAQKVTENIGSRTDDKFLQHLFHHGSFRSGACPSGRRSEAGTGTAVPAGTEKQLRPAVQTIYAAGCAQTAEPSYAEKQFQPSGQTFYAARGAQTTEPPHAEEHRSPGYGHP